MGVKVKAQKFQTINKALIKGKVGHFAHWRLHVLGEVLSRHEAEGEIGLLRESHNMAVDFGAALKRAEDAGLVGGGDYLKLKEGDNRLRLMSECLPHANEFQGKRNFKWLCYVLDRKDGKVKPFFMAHTIYKQIVALQQNPDYEFFDVPIPYDLTIHAIGAGTKEVKYTLMPARKNTPLTQAETALLAEQKPLAELQRKLQEKQAAKAAQAAPPAEDARHDDDDSAPLSDDDIPF